MPPVIYYPKTNPDLDPNPNPKRGAIFLGGQLSGYTWRKQSQIFKGTLWLLPASSLFFENFKSYSNGIFTLTEMHHSVSCQWKSPKLKITQWNSLMWHRYMSKLYHTIYLRSKCIVHIVFFSKWSIQ